MIDRLRTVAVVVATGGGGGGYAALHLSSLGNVAHGGAFNHRVCQVNERLGVHLGLLRIITFLTFLTFRGVLDLAQLAGWIIWILGYEGDFVETVQRPIPLND